MKKIFILLITVFSFSLLKAQEINTTNIKTNQPVSAKANKLVQTMKDSLILTKEQQEVLYKITLKLYSHKVVTRNNSGKVVIIDGFSEEQRDMLYKAILTDDQYRQYLQKKSRLLSTGTSEKKTTQTKQS